MLLDHVSATQMQAGQIAAGVTMVVFLAAPMLGRPAQSVRLIVTAVYVAGLLGFLLYFLW
jgi:hypothetical protein